MGLYETLVNDMWPGRAARSGPRASLAADPSPEKVRAAFPAGDGLAVQVAASDAGFLGSLDEPGQTPRSRSDAGRC